jgi:hypothetical protein
MQANFNKPVNYNNNDSRMCSLSLKQIPFNYWRSCYANIYAYEDMRQRNRYDVEREIWKLEQENMILRQIYMSHSTPCDIDSCRLPEPQNISSNGEIIDASKVDLPSSHVNIKFS